MTAKKSGFRWSDPALIISVLAFAIAGAAWVRTSSAAIAIPTGTIAVKAGSDLKYGGRVSFDTTASAYKKGYTYVNLVCLQNAHIVYQASNVGSFSDGVFPLKDLGGQGLSWPGGGANCTASLIYRIDAQRNPTIEYIAKTTFDVSAQ